MTELKPHDLVTIYHESRHSRINSLIFSGLSLGLAAMGMGAWVSHWDYRYPTALASWSLAIAAINRAADSGKQFAKYGTRRLVLEQASEQAYLSALQRSVVPSLPGLAIADQPSVQPYDWRDAVDSAVGFIIAGNSGSGKTSVACWLAGLLTAANPAQCLVLDPHWNDIWAENGLTAIGKISQIETTIAHLLTELDERCDRKGKGLPLGDPILVIADEIGACIERFSDPDTIITALKRLGSEGRKFGMTLIAINQSQNVEDLGISGQLRNNYFLVLLNAAARSRAKQVSAEMWDSIKGQPYPCVVSGCVEDAIAIHPTHGHYPQFKAKGNPPLNMLPIQQLPLRFLAPFEPLSVPDAAPTLEQFSQVIDHEQRNQLEKLYERSPDQPSPKALDFNVSDVVPELRPLLEYAIRKEWVTPSQIKANCRAYKETPTEEIKEYFAILTAQGIGRVREKGTTVEYSPFPA